MQLTTEGIARLRQAFLNGYPDFRDFGDSRSGYWKDERSYKDELVEIFHRYVRREIFDGLPDAAVAHGIAKAVHKVLTHPLRHAKNKPQNLLPWMYFAFLRSPSDEEALTFATALHDLLYGEEQSPRRVETFNQALWPKLADPPSPTWAPSRSLPTFFLMLQDPKADVFVRTETFKWTFRSLGIEQPFTYTLFDAAQYGQARDLVMAVREKLEEWGWQPRDLMDVQGFFWVSEHSNGPSPPPASPFDRLADSLRRSGLIFPPELVANYLLALQSKRFVLLTGISGTGKTKLAQAVAAHYRPTVRTRDAVEPPEDGLEIIARPYMLKYSQLVIPAALASRLRLPPLSPTSGGQLDTGFPAGRIQLTFWKDPQRGVLSVTFRAGFRKWFQEIFQPGDRFFLSVERSEDSERPDALRFTVPATREREEVLRNSEVVAVRPDWTDHRGLLGYLNPITQSYVVTPFLELLLRAREDESQAEKEERAAHPFFAILDEMNLARVEHYFADFLSCLESGEPLHFHDDQTIEEGGTEEGVPIPRRLKIPGNLFFTGTVNVDESTYMFSPKVLDRAFTVELNEVDLDALGSGKLAAPATDLALPGLPEELIAPNPPGAGDWQAFAELLDGSLAEVVRELHARLTETHRHFGYRVANEIGRFVNLAAEQGDASDAGLWAALDLALLQKVLPKFHGTQQELEEVLPGLFRFAAAGSGTEAAGDEHDWQAWRLDQGRLVLPSRESEGAARPRLPRTAFKLWRMLHRLRQQGFTSFIE